MKTLVKGTYLGKQADTVIYHNIILSKNEYQQKEDQGWHRHENPFFAYFLKGGNSELRKLEAIKCTAGSLLYYKAAEPHCNKDYTYGSKILHLEIDKKWFAEYKLNADIIPYTLIHHPLAKSVFLNIINEFSIRDELSEGSVQSLTYYLFNLLTRFSDSKKTNASWTSTFRKIINEQSDHELSLISIAKKLSIHPVTLSKEFPNYFNCTFGAYLRQFRIEKSLSLLAKKIAVYF